MTITNSLKTLRSLNKLSRTFLTVSTTQPLFYANRFLSPLCKCSDPTTSSSPLTHVAGPLFLSLPPWKLSQSATPVYVRGGDGGVVLRKVKELNCLIRSSRGRFPVRLGLDARVKPEVWVSTVGLGLERGGSGDGGVVENWVNLPNFVSVARLVSGPFIGWMITSEMYSSACVALAISGATDWLDGYLARKMKIDSVVGSYLDPLADKVLIGCVAVAMVQNDLLHPGLVALIVARDALLVGGAVYRRATSLDWKWNSWSDFLNLDGTSPHKVEPLFISKVNTVFQLVLVAAALLQPEFGTQETQVYITYLSWLVASTTMASTVAYGTQYMRGSAALTH